MEGEARTERLDRILMARNPEMTRSRIEGLVKAGLVRVNGVAAAKAGQKVRETDEIEMEIPPPVPAIPQPEDIPLSVVFEDDDLAVVDKPAGLVVHPAPGHSSGTLVNALLHRYPGLGGIGGVARPGIVHRLDQDTSGLIVVAKTEAAMAGLAKAFSTHRSVEKTYLAVCHGRPRLAAGRIENMIGRHPVDRKRMAILEKGGKLAITEWKAARTLGGEAGSPAQAGRRDASPALTLFECRILTGRTHQIRVHMASLGCPVIGDAVYGKSALDRRLVPPPQRQMLHAWRLAFWHPVRNVPLSFEAPPPDDMAVYLRASPSGDGAVEAAEPGR